MSNNKLNNLFIDLSKELKISKENLDKEKEILEKERENFEIEKLQFYETSKKIEILNDNEPIALYIGSKNHIYLTRISVLKRVKDSFFDVMFSGRHNLKEYNGKKRSYFIDRDGDYFNFILNYLRGDKIIVPKDNFILKKLILDCKFYMLNELEDIFKQEYIKLNPNYSIITSSSSSGQTSNNKSSNFITRKSNFY